LNSSGFVSKYTDGKAVATVQDYIGMHQAGYLEYLPFKSRMSPFWNSDWSAWPTAETGTGLGILGMGAEKPSNLHFQATPLGFYSVSSNHATRGDVTAWTTGPVKSLTANTSSINGISGSGLSGNAYQAAEWMLPGLDASGIKQSSLASFTSFGATSGWTEFDATSLSNTTWIASETTSLVNKLYSWYDAAKEATYANVASRMMQFEALAHAQCAGFICIIVVQWADLMICKTRWLSIRQQRMINPIMNFGLLFETLLGTALCYIPGLGDVLGTRPLRLNHWVPGVPFCLFIFFYDETRKYLMRKTSKKIVDSETRKVTSIKGWLERNTYY
jgi:sodium/potassium-transporting ATPase subunit alpha